MGHPGSKGPVAGHLSNSLFHRQGTPARPIAEMGFVEGVANIRHSQVHAVQL